MTRLRRIAPALGLFVMAPFVAEFLLGNLSITLLPALVVLAPMYGGGALLAREVVRRTGRGWPSLLVLGLAYGLLEEAFTTQSLFNPNYLHANLHLLDQAYIPALGIGARWTLFVLTLHTVWSVGTSIALVEAFVPARRTTPWLGWMGLSVTAVLFAVGIAATTAITFQSDAFIASPAQLAASAALMVLLIVAAFRLPRASAASAAHRLASARTPVPPNPWIVGAGSLAAASLFLLVPRQWGWGAVGAYLALYGLAISAGVRWSRTAGWGNAHRLAVAGGSALAYAWHAFPEQSVAGSPQLDLAGNALFAAILVGVLVIAARRTSAGPHEPRTAESALAHE